MYYRTDIVRVVLCVFSSLFIVITTYLSMFMYERTGLIPQKYQGKYCEMFYLTFCNDPCLKCVVRVVWA